MLFNSTEEIKGFLPQNAAFSLEQILPFVAEAEEDLIVPSIGVDQYTALNVACSSNTFTAPQGALLAKVRKPLANYAYLKYLPFAQLTFSAGGIHIEVNDQKKNAPEWMIRDLENSCAEAADKGIENVFEFMELNKTDYPLWTASDCYTVFKECFINTSKEFTRYFNIGNSRRTFLALKSIMLRVENFAIKSIICKTLFDSIKVEIKAGTISSDNAALLEYINPAVALLTGERALTDLNVRITADGVRLTASSPTSSTLVKAPAEVNRITAMQKAANGDAEVYLKGLTAFLYENADTYPTWKNSTCYIDPDSDDAAPFDQTGNGIVSF